MVEKKPSKESRPPLFFLPSTPQKFACGFCLSGKASFVVYELASLLQFIFCSITIQFATTLAARYTKWLFMSFQDNLVKVEERKKCWRKPLKILQLRRWKTWFSLTTDEWSWSRLRLSIRMNKSQRISRGLHWRERRFCCQTTHTRVPKGKTAVDKARYVLHFCVMHLLKYSIWWWLSKKSIPYGFGTCICMCHIANAHFSCCPTKIWSSWWWVTLGCKYYAVALCSITWLTHIWPFLHLITYSRLA